MTADCLQQKLLGAMESAGLSEFLAGNRVQVLNLADELFVEIVVSNAAREQEIRRAALSALGEADQKDVSLIVRSQWAIAEIGGPEPVYGTHGTVRAAVLIPVTLASGEERLQVTVAVTKLAEMELDSILRRKVSMPDVAEVVVSNALRRGGQSYWDPRLDGYLEVGSSVAPQISRLLKKSA